MRHKHYYTLTLAINTLGIGIHKNNNENTLYTFLNANFAAQYGLFHKGKCMDTVGNIYETHHHVILHILSRKIAMRIWIEVDLYKPASGRVVFKYIRTKFSFTLFNLLHIVCILHVNNNNIHYHFVLHKCVFLYISIALIFWCKLGYLEY